MLHFKNAESDIGAWNPSNEAEMSDAEALLDDGQGGIILAF